MGAFDPKTPLDEVDTALHRLLGADLSAATLMAASQSMPAAESRGELSENDFVLLLGRAFKHGFTGRLRLQSLDGDATVWFAGGLVVDVAVPTATTAERASAPTPRVEHWLFEVAGWRDGTFQFDPTVSSPSGASDAVDLHRTHVLRHPAALGYEVLLRRDADRALEFWRGDRKNRFRLVWPTADDVLSGLEPDLQTAVRLFDGGRTFAEVVKGGQVEEGRVLKAAFLLFCFGALAPTFDEALNADAFDDRARANRQRIEALFKLAEESDYFVFLGVDREASRHEILAAAARMQRELRPDEQHPDIALATARQRAVISEVLAEAIRVLGDDHLRARHLSALPTDS
ncbi:MAG TPA: DUF4388 domain-containing protein [Polyangia bacterium]